MPLFDSSYYIRPSRHCHNRGVNVHETTASTKPSIPRQTVRLAAAKCKKSHKTRLVSTVARNAADSIRLESRIQVECHALLTRETATNAAGLKPACCKIKCNRSSFPNTAETAMSTFGPHCTGCMCNLTLISQGSVVVVVLTIFIPHTIIIAVGLRLGLE